ncbi:hypothetical protein C8E05_3813 [Rhodococcus wratislaviensis]|uniref:Uncharacterized protein n=1 Tax=Rhodococcus wratislaviensis TaxID=44752 RepID=A0AB38FL36_RHOWR|nr:hypothetical protein [Rhodococcus wratislaviensis]REE74378.1 hypothetical protein C8E05_3813 [Rhodococcus wratislaviensis]SPZ42085.1 Uncharacterised protein [Rhodococcus wratislaviensis]
MTTPTIVMRMLEQDFPRAGAAIPPTLTVALADLNTTFDTSNQVLDSTDPTWRAELSAAVAAALSAGKPLAEDKTVRTLLMSRQLRDVGVPGMVADHVEQERRRIITDHADVLFGELTSAFDEAADAIEAAREVIPRVDLSSRGALSSVPAAHMTTWGEAYDAAGRIRTIVGLWTMLATFTRRFGALQNDLRPLLIADLSADQLDEIPAPRSYDAPVLAGQPLSLADPDELLRRCERVQQEWHERQQRQLEGSAPTGWNRVR